MRNQLMLMRAMATLLTVTLTITPLYSFSADIKQTGREAQTFGLGLSDSFSNNSGDVENGTMTFPTLENGQFNINSGSDLKLSDLYPGTSNGAEEGYYFPDSGVDIDSLTDVYDSDSGLNSVGNAAQESLWADANSELPTISGSAFKILFDATDRSRPDFSNDPAFSLSQNTYDNMDVIADEFGDCTTESTISEIAISTHVPDYHQCDRLYKPTGACTILHSIDVSVDAADVVFLIDNSGSMGDVVEDLRNNVRAFSELLSQGNEGKLRLGGAAYREREYTSNKIDLTPEFSSFKSWINQVTASSAATYPFDAITHAVKNFSWREDPEVRKVLVLIGNQDSKGNRSAAVQALAESNIELFVFHDNDDVNSIGTHLSDYFSGPLLLKFAQRMTVLSEKWTPSGCVQDAIATLEGFCRGSYTAVPEVEPACLNLSGFNVCEGDPIYEQLGTPPLPNIHVLTQKVEVSELACDYNYGQGTCWTDKDGNQQCLENFTDVDQCEQYEVNPQCGFISSECVDGAEGVYGNCYVKEDTYDCGAEVNVPSLEKKTTYECSGSIECMGDECLDIAKSQSTDFARASALLNAAQFMTQDMSCTDITGAENSYCEAFSGESGECKIAVGGAQDCCEKPEDISMSDYLQLIMAVPKLDAAVMGLEQGSAIKGAYQILREPAMQGWTEITKPFTSYIENVSGAVDSFVQPIEQVIDGVVDKLQQKIKDIMAEVFKSTAEDAASEQAAAAAAGQAGEELAESALMQSATTFLSTAMTIYSAYVVTMLLIQIIWKCEEEEFALNAKRALESCTYVGSYCKTEVGVIKKVCIEKRKAYCCFNSPLSRIIQEQIHLVQGETFGSSKNPQCGGIPLSELATIDWSQINLDEWLGLLQQNGQFPTDFSANDKLSIDTLTGVGSDLDTDGTRENAIERFEERIEGIDVDEIRRESASQISPNLPEIAD